MWENLEGEGAGTVTVTEVDQRARLIVVFLFLPHFTKVVIVVFWPFLCRSSLPLSIYQRLQFLNALARASRRQLSHPYCLCIPR